MKIAVQNCSNELEIKKSRFLSETFSISTQEQARAVLKSKKEQYSDAAHVVHGFICGQAGEISGCSDDGEPSGTAGRPVLEVLKGSEITNILLTVTRWFGGTLLGTGGLVKAYTEAAKKVLEKTPVEELVPLYGFTVTLSYECIDRFKRECTGKNIKILSEEFAADIEVAGIIDQRRSAEFSLWVSDLTSGRSHVVLSEENPRVRQI